jgi:hypothetical protein
MRIATTQGTAGADALGGLASQNNRIEYRGGTVDPGRQPKALQGYTPRYVFSPADHSAEVGLEM